MAAKSLHTAAPAVPHCPAGLRASPSWERGAPSALSKLPAGEHCRARLRLHSHLVKRRAEGREAGREGKWSRGGGAGASSTVRSSCGPRHCQLQAAARVRLLLPLPPPPLKPQEPRKALPPPPPPPDSPAAPAWARAVTPPQPLLESELGPDRTALGWAGGAWRRGGQAGEDSRVGAPLPGSRLGLHPDRCLPAHCCPRPHPGLGW